jgi:hypothetical protein
MDISSLATAMGIGAGSGINVYQTALLVCFLYRDQIPLGSMVPIMVVAVILYIVEFFADKTPGVDSLWDMIHILIRPLGGAYIVGTFGQYITDQPSTFPMALTAFAFAVPGMAAKLSGRAAINTSPEPATNIATSILEDIVAFILVWLSRVHPVLAIGVIGVFSAVCIWITARLVRFLRLIILAIRNVFLRERMREYELPASWEEKLDTLDGKGIQSDILHSLRCIVSRAHGLRRGVSAYFLLHPDGVSIVYKRKLKIQRHGFRWTDITKFSVKTGFIRDEIRYNSSGHVFRLIFPKGSAGILREMDSKYRESVPR